MWMLRARAEWGSALQLDRQARWVVHRPTPDPRRGCQVVGAGPGTPRDSTRRVTQAGRPITGPVRPALEKVSEPGGECLGQSLAQGGRVGAGWCLPEPRD